MSMVHKQRTEPDLKEIMIGERSWSDLPVGILSTIMEYLSPVDQIHFRAVCNDWRQARPVHFLPKLPWQMTHDWDSSDNGNVLSINKLHMPFHKQSYISQHELDGKDWGDIFGASICASKFGWLLFQKHTKSFVYNPFTREILKLPNMDITFNRATFSSVPTSPDCMFFAMQSSKKSCVIRISTLSPGDRKWTTKTFNGFFKVIEDVVYSNGKFYCVFSCGVLGAYSVANKDWTLLTGMDPINRLMFQERAQMIDSDGALLLVCLSGGINIYRYDWLEMAWVKINSLENQALFLGCTSFAVSALEEETCKLADRIYYHGSTHACFHWFGIHMRHQCSEIYPLDTQYGLEKVWIDSPQF